jgi:hypothetical protein
MPDPFLDPILRRIDRAQRTTTRMGVITDIDVDDASLTVDCSGDIITGVRWYDHYAPVVADFIDILCVGGSSWRVLGKLSKQLGAGSVTYGSVTVSPSHAEFVWRSASAPEWSAYTYYDLRAGSQGRHPLYDNTGAIVYMFPALPPALPSGATVTGARITFRRLPDSFTGLPLVEPVVWQHDVTVIPLGHDVDPPPTTGTVWRPGFLAVEQVASWELPSAWLTAWLAGTTKGITLYTETIADYMVVGGGSNADLLLSYSVPT